MINQIAASFFPPEGPTVNPQYQPSQRQWVGLTKREFQEAVDGLEDLEDCWVAIEATLRSKNT